ncbi:MAG TPA: hypothetical protein VHA52_07765, partial [Candidatus Babeliaceae bacterium]|nr:hypothetical protein [Candidatus Babeliaceae bacterium]
MLISLQTVATGQASAPFKYSALRYQGDLSSLMVQEIDSFLMNQTHETALNREKLWKRDFSSESAFDRSILSQRALLRKILGVVDRRVSDPEMVLLSDDDLKPFQLKLD